MAGSLPHGRAGKPAALAMLNGARAQDFIRENTTVLAPPHVPEIKLHLADEAHDLWHKTEEELGQIGLQPPFWAFAWAGGQGLARYILDNPAIAKGKNVLDFATGSGLVAIAAKGAGAKYVLANDIDLFCGAAVQLNAKINDVEISFSDASMVGDMLADFDVVLAGDVFYDRAMVDAIWPWFQQLHAQGKHILIGDPGRSYLPKDALKEQARYQVSVTRMLEDAEVKQTIIWALR